MDEGTCLENRHTLSAYRGFESRPLRHAPLSLFFGCCHNLGGPSDEVDHTCVTMKDPYGGYTIGTCRVA